MAASSAQVPQKGTALGGRGPPRAHLATRALAFAASRPQAMDCRSLVLRGRPPAASQRPALCKNVSAIQLWLAEPV
jgi:hypothetical protein